MEQLAEKSTLTLELSVRYDDEWGRFKMSRGVGVGVGEWAKACCWL